MKNNKVAVKSGYYFEIFDKNEIPLNLKLSDYKVKLDGIIYDLYKATTLEQEREIDNMYGDRMGYYIDDYIVKY